jgi:hypothetical protein
MCTAENFALNLNWKVGKVLEIRGRLTILGQSALEKDFVFHKDDLSSYNDDWSSAKMSQELRSVAVGVCTSVMTRMWALAHWREKRPVVSPETRSAAHRLQEQ